MKFIRIETEILDFGKEFFSYKEKSSQARILTRVYFLGFLVHTDIQFKDYEYHRNVNFCGTLGVAVSRPQAITIVAM